MGTHSHFLFNLREKFASIVMIGIIFSSLGFIFLLAHEKNHKVTTDFLIVQNSGPNQDLYTLSKSAEYLGGVLGEAVYSELFITEVINTGKISENSLPIDKKERLREWNGSINVKRNSTSGILNVEVFDDNQKKAMAISEGIREVFTTKNSLFRGEGQSIDVRVLSGPVSERNPNQIEMLLVVIGGFLFGVGLSIIRIYYKSMQVFY